MSEDKAKPSAADPSTAGADSGEEKSDKVASSSLVELLAEVSALSPALSKACSTVWENLLLSDNVKFRSVDISPTGEFGQKLHLANSPQVACTFGFNPSCEIFPEITIFILFLQVTAAVYRFDALYGSSSAEQPMRQALEAIMPVPGGTGEVALMSSQNVSFGLHLLEVVMREGKRKPHNTMRRVHAHSRSS